MLVYNPNVRKLLNTECKNRRLETLIMNKKFGARYFYGIVWCNFAG